MKLSFKRIVNTIEKPMDEMNKREFKGLLIFVSSGTAIIFLFAFLLLYLTFKDLKEKQELSIDHNIKKIEKVK